MVAVAFVLLLQSATSAVQPLDPIVSEAVITAPAREVWDAFTTTPGIESWMVASGDISLKVGGRLRTSYRKAADLDGETAIHQEILSFDPGRMLSYRVIKTPKDFPFPAAILKTWTVIYLEPVTPASTRVTVKMFGYEENAESGKMRAFFETGNKATLDALVKRFSGR